VAMASRAFLSSRVSSGRSSQDSTAAEKWVEKLAGKCWRIASTAYSWAGEGGGGGGFVQVRIERRHCPFNPCTICDPLAVGVKQGGDVSSLWSLFDSKKKFFGDEVAFQLPSQPTVYFAPCYLACLELFKAASYLTPLFLNCNVLLLRLKKDVYYFQLMFEVVFILPGH
jgi:hypothetical protein